MLTKNISSNTLSIAVLIAYLIHTISCYHLSQENFIDYGLNGKKLLRKVEHSFGTFGRSYGAPNLDNYDPNYDPHYTFIRSPDSVLHFRTLRYRTITFEVEPLTKRSQRNRYRGTINRKHLKKCKKNGRNGKKSCLKKKKKKTASRARLSRRNDHKKYELKKITYRTKPLTLNDFIKVLKINEKERNNRI